MGEARGGYDMREVGGRYGMREVGGRRGLGVGRMEVSM